MYFWNHDSKIKSRKQTRQPNKNKFYEEIMRKFKTWAATKIIFLLKIFINEYVNRLFEPLITILLQIS